MAPCPPYRETKTWKTEEIQVQIDREPFGEGVTREVCSLARWVVLCGSCLPAGGCWVVANTEVVAGAVGVADVEP